MKNLILGLVLATLTLPAMAISQAQQDKLNNAMAVLTSFGINPVVVKDSINETNEFYKLTNLNANGGDTSRWAQDIQDKFVGGNMIVNTSSGASFVKNNSAGPGLFDITLMSSSTVDSGKSFGVYIDNSWGKEYTWLVNGNQVGAKKKIKLDLYTLESAMELCAGAYSGYCYGATIEEKAQNFMEDYNYSWKYKRATEYAYQQFIDQNDFVYRESDKLDVGSAVGRVIIGKAKELKTVIKNTGLYVAAAEIGKGAASSCDINYAVVCSSVVEKFISISSQLTPNLITPESYVKGTLTYYLEDDGKFWTEDGQYWGSLAYFQYKEGQGAAKHYDAVTHAGIYNDSLSDISDISNAYITVMDEDFTFGDL